MQLPSTHFQPYTPDAEALQLTPLYPTSQTLKPKPCRKRQYLQMLLADTRPVAEEGTS